ncbi:MAG: hypothetical protein ACYTJ0_03620 [Planctomycetota bacterium]
MTHWRLTAVGAAMAIVTISGPVGPAHAGDHGDTPTLIGAARHDARLTDLFAFTNDDRLVLALCLDPTIPPEVTKYLFASDLKIRIHIDRDSAVSFDDPDAVATYGGSVVDPRRIKSDVSLRVDFRSGGQPRLHVTGIHPSAQREIQLFAGLRDDPFIRGPRIGRNVAAVVIELPLAAVLDDQDALLIWATATVPGFRGPFQEMVGRALRSQFPENMPMNTMPPRMHEREMDVVPDVMIYDVALPAAFPNGRALTDDVVDLVGDDRVLMNDDPFPTENDLPFLEAFPYLAPPHAP